MKRGIWTLAALFLAGGCAYFCDVAEFGELEKPEVRFAQFQEGVALHVEGQFSRTGGRVVESVRQIRNGREIHIEVRISPFERDDTGTGFATDVFLDGVDRVTFGNRKTLLWRRHPDSGELPSKAKPVFKREE